MRIGTSVMQIGTRLKIHNNKKNRLNRRDRNENNKNAYSIMYVLCFMNRDV